MTWGETREGMRPAAMAISFNCLAKPSRVGWRGPRRQRGMADYDGYRRTPRTTVKPLIVDYLVKIGHDLDA